MPAYHHPIFKAQYVVASISTLGYWMPLRVAGAQARRVLLDAAAEKWGVAAAELTTEPSVVVHAPTGRKLGYGEIAAFAKAPAEPPKIDPTKDLKPVDRFRLVGKGVPRVDVPAKSTGAASYGIDARVPGMVYATMVRAPVRGSSPGSSNADAIRKLPGIIDVVSLGHGVAIVGQTFNEVRKARAQLKVSWGNAPGTAINTDKDLEWYVADGRDLKRVGVEWKSKGNAAAAIAGAAKVVSREYLNDHVYHAQMEPMNSTASVYGDRVEIWVGTQAPTRTTLDVAQALGTSPDKVQLHPHLMGGGFGRRATVETSVDAALISKAVGRPVKLLLTREDDLLAGTFRPMTSQRIDAGLDKDGRIVGWRHRVVGEPVGDFVYRPGYVKAAKDRDAIFMSGRRAAVLQQGRELALGARHGAGAHAGRRVARHRLRATPSSRSSRCSTSSRTRTRSIRSPSGCRSPTTRARGACSRRSRRCPAGASRARGTALGIAFAEYGHLRAEDRLAGRRGRGDLGRSDAPAGSASTTTGWRPTPAWPSIRARSPRRSKARSSGG